MIRRLALTLAIASSALTAGALRAQSMAPAAEPTTVSAPAREAAVAGLRVSNRQAHRVGELAPAQGIKNRGRPVAYMVAGGAAFIGGLLIGDDVGTVVALGGLGFFVYGLYLYSR